MEDKKQEEPRMTQACESKARNEASLRTKREYSAREIHLKDTQSGEGAQEHFWRTPSESCPLSSVTPVTPHPRLDLFHPSQPHLKTRLGTPLCLHKL